MNRFTRMSAAAGLAALFAAGATTAALANPAVTLGGFDLLSGKRQHSPITITKETDSSSPNLFRAALTNGTTKTTIHRTAAAQPKPKRPRKNPNGSSGKIIYPVKSLHASKLKIESNSSGSGAGK